MLYDWPERKSRKVSERAHDEDNADQQTYKKRAMSWKSSGRHGHLPLRRERAGDGEQRQQHQESANQHRETERQVVPGGIRVDACEGASVICGTACVGVKDFREAVRAGIIRVSCCRPGRVPVRMLRKPDDRTGASEDK